MDEYIDPERSTIKIGFPTSLASSILPQLLAEFKSAYPNIKIQLQQGSYNELINIIKDRELNLAILGPVVFDDPLIKGHPLFYEKMYLLLPHQHRGRCFSQLRLRGLQRSAHHPRCGYVRLL